MPTDILLAVVATSVVQSVFGVGVLLFGTPCCFYSAMALLTPDFIRICRFTVFPLAVLFLLVVTTVKINISLVIGPVLIFVALKNFSTVIDRTLQSVVKYERIT